MGRLGDRAVPAVRAVGQRVARHRRRAGSRRRLRRFPRARRRRDDFEVGRRSGAALRTLAAALHVDGAARDLATRHPPRRSPRPPPPSSRATRASALGGEAGALVRPWIRRGARQSPDRFLRAARTGARPTAAGGRRPALAVHWVYGICSIGAARAHRARLGRTRRGARVRARPPVGRARGERQRQQAAPPGARRLRAAGGPGGARRRPLNDVRHCVDDPFGWAKDDEDAGDAAVRRRPPDPLTTVRRANSCCRRRASNGAAAAADGAPCGLAFGPPGADPAGAPRVRRARRRRGGAAVCRQACYASCAGALSATHAAAALSHVVA